MVCGYACVCAHMLTLPHAPTESQFDQSALSALLLCFVIPGFLAMGWQFVKSWLDLASSVATEAKSVSSASSAMKLVKDVLVEVGDIEIGAMRKNTVHPDETGNPILDLGDKGGFTGRATPGPQPDQASSPLTTLPPY